ncbi:hypothetical protein [Polaromonas sp.]|uniref:hypothetical protein n=1 Tax=Polaromonas sp. TaxID=1869339 RepID=UPI002FCBA328
MRRLRLVQLDPRPFLALICLSTLMLLLPAAAQTAAQPTAAAPHDPRTSMLPDVRGAVPWSLLSAATIKMSNGKLGPAFPAALRPFHGKTVKLQGYILPIEAGRTHSYFLLSAWSPTCPFCQTAGPEAMVEVRARTAVKYSIDPVVVEGRLVLLDNDPSGVFYRLVEAVPASL